MTDKTVAFFNSWMGKIIAVGVALGVAAVALSVALGIVKPEDLRQGGDTVAGITMQEFKAELKDQLEPLKETDREQTQQINELARELANLKGRLQLAGLTTRGRSSSAGIQQ